MTGDDNLNSVKERRMLNLAAGRRHPSRKHARITMCPIGDIH